MVPGSGCAVASSRLSRDGETITGCRKRPCFAVAVMDAMLSAFIVILPCPMYEAAVSAPADCGTSPSRVTIPVCQSRPMPKYLRAVSPSAVPAMPFALSGLIALMKALLQERRKLSFSVPFGMSKSSRLWKVTPSHWTVGGHSTAEPGPLTTPLSIIIAAVTIFIVEPGACAPCTAVLKPPAGLLAMARIAPVLGVTATTDAWPYFFTATSAAACTPASRVVCSRPSLPLVSVSSVWSGTFWSADLMASSIPGVPPASSPYFLRSWSRTGPSDGYFSAASSTPLRSTALIGGVVALSVARESPLVSFGCTTVGDQSTSALPVVCPRTTVSSEAYDQGLLFPSYVTVALTVNGTLAPTAVPGVITALETRACSR